MAQASDYLSALAQYHPGVDLMSQQPLQQAAQGAAGGGMSTTDFVNKYNNDPSILSAYNQKYQTLAQPQQTSLDTQIGSLNNMQTLNKNAADLSTTQTNQGYDQANRQAQRDSGNAQMNVYNLAQDNGFGNTVLSTGGQQQIQADLGHTLSYNEANRANALAGIQLNNQAQNTQISGSIGQINGQKGALSYQTATNAQDAYNQNTTDQFNRQNALFNDALQLPQGRSISTGPSVNVQGALYDPTSYITALSKLTPILQTMGTGPEAQAFADQAAQSMATQFGVPINQAISYVKSIMSGNKPAAYSGGGGSGGGNTQSYQAPAAAPQNNQIGDATAQISKLSGNGDFAGNANKYISLLQNNYPGMSYQQAYSIWRKAVPSAPAAQQQNTATPSNYTPFSQQVGGMDMSPSGGSYA